MAGRDAAIPAPLDELVESAAALNRDPAVSTEWHAGGTNRAIRQRQEATLKEEQAFDCGVVVMELREIEPLTHFHAMQFRLLLRRWPSFLAGRRGPSWATSGCEYADQPARDGGQDRGERVRHRDPVVDERGPGDGTDDEVQAKGGHDREIQLIG
jgi:hypothetical protein